jgi:hypothetical protein
MGHLDVVIKLVELGGDWPHGKGVDEESDVVTQLVEHYNGPRKMQVGGDSVGHHADPIYPSRQQT